MATPEQASNILSYGTNKITPNGPLLSKTAIIWLIVISVLVFIVFLTVCILLCRCSRSCRQKNRQAKDARNSFRPWNRNIPAMPAYTTADDPHNSNMDLSTLERLEGKAHGQQKGIAALSYKNGRAGREPGFEHWNRNAAPLAATHGAGGHRQSGEPGKIIRLGRAGQVPLPHIVEQADDLMPMPSTAKVQRNSRYYSAIPAMKRISGGSYRLSKIGGAY